MSRIILYTAALLMLVAIGNSCQVKQASDPKVMELDALAQRLFGAQAKAFVFDIDTTQADREYFVYHTERGKVHIRGNSLLALATGLNHYLTNECHTHVSWYADDTVVLPERLPEISTPVAREAQVPTRFFLNYCTFGYTMPFWQWHDWERFIDWMALNGVTMPLATSGQEQIWLELWQEMGLDEDAVRAYFTGPAHLPWHRMNNVDRWQGPLPQSWIDAQAELQKRILNRERAFGMTPVLPGFSGHVPKELQSIFPDADITEVSMWGGFGDKYRTYFLSPSDPLFAQIQESYIKKQTNLFGTDHIYGIDPFNEIGLERWDASYLGEVASQLYKSLRTADPEARWLQMTWMFYYDKKKWTPENIRSFITSVPKDRLILLDYYCDHTEIWKQTECYHGQPFVWCYLGNFGGNTWLCGDLPHLQDKLDTALSTPQGKRPVGLGGTLEALDLNPVVHEYVLARAWEPELSAEEWIDLWSLMRGGYSDPRVSEAWRTLLQTAYHYPTASGQGSLINARPKLEGVYGWSTYYYTPQYDNARLMDSWQLLAESNVVPTLPGYRSDLVNIGCQVLGNYFSTLRDHFTQAYQAKDTTAMRQTADEMLTLLDDVERLLACHPNRSLTKWLSDARSFAATPEELDYYTTNAKSILTVWGERGGQLNDYANRTWAGLVSCYYKERWVRFLEGAIKAVRSGHPFDEAHFLQEITTFEESWAQASETDLPAHPETSAKTISQELIKTYRDRIQ